MSRTNNTHSTEQTHPPSDRDIIYVGYRQSGQAIVEKRPRQERLTPERSLELVDHGPSGFEWGCGGSGPTQLALALLLDYTEDETFALDHHQEFKTEVVSQLDCAGAEGHWRLIMIMPVIYRGEVLKALNKPMSWITGHTLQVKTRTNHYHCQRDRRSPSRDV